MFPMIWFQMSSEDGCRLVVTHHLWSLTSSQDTSASRGKFSDDDVEVEGEEEDSFAIPAHRKLLAGVSPKFRQLLVDQGRARVVVPGVTSLALLDVVAFVYTGRIQFKLKEDCDNFVATLGLLEVHLPDLNIRQNLAMTTKVIKDLNSNNLGDEVAPKMTLLGKLPNKGEKVEETMTVWCAEATYMKRRGSAVVGRIRSESGAMLRFEPSPQPPYNRLTLYGEKEQVARAKEIISELCQNTLVIPITYKQRLPFVGRGGVREEVEKATGASLWAPVVPTETGKIYRLVVAGSRGQVERAMGEVAGMLR